MTKIICISDNHSNFPKIPLGDILLHAGDLTANGSEKQVRDALEWLGGLEHPTKILVPGNHDWMFQLDPDRARELCEEQGVTLLIDEEYRVNGLSIWGAPWQPWFHDWAFNVERGPDIQEKWDLIPRDIDVLVTHGPPMMILDNNIKGWMVGCEDLLIAVREIKPKLHVFGHIHHSNGVRVFEKLPTLFVNACLCDEQYQCCNPPVIAYV